MKKNVLVLGSGGREHALALRILSSPSCNRCYLYPGNGGTESLLPSDSVSIDLQRFESFLPLLKRLNIDLIVIGPEDLLNRGAADFFVSQGYAVFGPTRQNARLETSKLFAKDIMRQYEVPTSQYWVTRNAQEFRDFAASNQVYPIVAKADGLKAGKGVLVAHTYDELLTYAFADEVTVIESFLPGKEMTLMGLCDGRHFVMLPSATDYKRVFDGQKGPNTGGMGAISPSPSESEALMRQVQEKIVRRLMPYLSTNNYRGVLYLGLMISPSLEPSVLEFNCRFGDPETQCVLPNIATDFLELLWQTSQGELPAIERVPTFPGHSLYLVATSGGYPGHYEKGFVIEGVDHLEQDTSIIFSGVSKRDNNLFTEGGRVLGIGVRGTEIEEVKKRIYNEIKKISFERMHYRTDIGD